METTGIKPRQLGLGGEFAQIKPTDGLPSVDKPLTLADKKNELAKKNAWKKEPPTDAQILGITRLAMKLGDNYPYEERVSNKMEAQETLYRLKIKSDRINREHKLKRQAAKNK